MRLTLLIFGFALIVSCEYEHAEPQSLSAACGVESPQTNLPWLRDLIERIKSDPKYVSVVITACEYKGKTIFNIQDAISSCAFCDLRDCPGNKFSPSDFNDFVVNKKNERKVWCQQPDFCAN